MREFQLSAEDIDDLHLVAQVGQRRAAGLKLMLFDIVHDHIADICPDMTIRDANRERTSYANLRRALLGSES